MDALRLEAGLRREAPQDQERAGAGEAAAAGVQEQLGPVPPVEERPAAALVAADGLGGRPADRDDPLLAALADAADEPVLEVDAGALEPDRLADAQAGAVEELDERAVAEVARGRCRPPPRSGARPRRARACAGACGGAAAARARRPGSRRLRRGGRGGGRTSGRRRCGGRPSRARAPARGALRARTRAPRSSRSRAGGRARPRARRGRGGRRRRCAARGARRGARGSRRARDRARRAAARAGVRGAGVRLLPRGSSTAPQRLLSMHPRELGAHHSRPPTAYGRDRYVSVPGPCRFCADSSPGCPNRTRLLAAVSCRCGAARPAIAPGRERRPG